MSDSMRFNTGEVDLAYTEWPGDSPPLLALHGISGGRAAHLARWKGCARHAYAYDARGHADSSRAPGAYTFVDFGRDVVAFLKGVVKQPAILVGHSLGGMAAIYAAAHAPEHVKAAFLVDPPLYAPEVPLRDERAPFANVERQAGKPVGELVASGVPDERAVSLSKLDPEVMTMVLDGRAFAGWDTDECLKAIDCPVVLEHGDRDQGSVIYPGELERATPLLRNGRLLHLPGTGHLPWAVDPIRFYAELSRFVDEHGGT